MSTDMPFRPIKARRHFLRITRWCGYEKLPFGGPHPVIREAFRSLCPKVDLDRLKSVLSRLLDDRPEAGRHEGNPAWVQALVDGCFLLLMFSEAQNGCFERGNSGWTDDLVKVMKLLAPHCKDGVNLQAFRRLKAGSRKDRPPLPPQPSADLMAAVALIFVDNHRAASHEEFIYATAMLYVKEENPPLAMHAIVDKKRPAESVYYGETVDRYRAVMARAWMATAAREASQNFVKKGPGFKSEQPHTHAGLPAMNQYVELWQAGKLPDPAVMLVSDDWGQKHREDGFEVSPETFKALPYLHRLVFRHDVTDSRGEHPSLCRCLLAYLAGGPGTHAPKICGNTGMLAVDSSRLILSHPEKLCSVIELLSALEVDISDDEVSRTRQMADHLLESFAKELSSRPIGTDISRKIEHAKRRIGETINLWTHTQRLSQAASGAFESVVAVKAPAVL